MPAQKFPESEVEAKEMKFKSEGLELGGYLAQPKTSQALPGLLLIHEWWGLNDHIKDVARRYAREGFVTLAVDLYGGRVAKDADQASRWMGELKPEAGVRSIRAAFSYLHPQPYVKSGRIGITGFCMGGSFTLLGACHIPEMKAAAPFYGDIPDPDDPIKNIRCPLLFIGAEKDAWITVDKMNRLKTAIQKYGLAGEVQVYPGAQHAFFNNTRPDGYNVDSASDAWGCVTGFLHQHLD